MTTRLLTTRLDTPTLLSSCTKNLRRYLLDLSARVRLLAKTND